MALKENLSTKDETVATGISFSATAKTSHETVKLCYHNFHGPKTVSYYKLGSVIPSKLPRCMMEKETSESGQNQKVEWKT